MFTGIVTDIADVAGSKKTADGLKLTFARPDGWTDLALGESVATDGACLTVHALRKNEYDCLLTPETLAKTSFGERVPVRVNLERALLADGRFSGHFVQGHVDGVGHVTRVTKDDGWRLTINYEPAWRPYLIPKGSIAVNGVSLTVADLTDEALTVALIPHTLEHTTLGALKVHDAVNLEFDMIGKYIIKTIKKR